MKRILALSIIGLMACAGSLAQSGASNAGKDDRSTPGGGSQQITNGPVAEYVSDSACTIGWSTSSPGKMSLQYGTDRSKMMQTADAVESKDGRNHHAQLSGLTPNTRYFFQVLRNGETVGNAGTFQTVETGEQPIKSAAIIPH